MLQQMKPTVFQRCLLAWFEQKGRKNLPWRTKPTPYRVWVSEIMLQQTQVTTVIPYYHRFMARFPKLADLAAAPLDTVMHYWSGLGYYARARYLHKAAKVLRHDQHIPARLDQLMALPGIGRSTAGAIMSIAFKTRAPILDGNVKRIFCRFKLIDGWPGHAKVAQELWRLSEVYTPETQVSQYTQAIMDLGATICTRKNPLCNQCPLANFCQAFREGRICEFPTPRPLKQNPVRKCYFLVLRNCDNSFFLENRASSGRWGGLWSFPEFKERQDILNWCVSKNLTEPRLKYLPARRHTFSHFHLEYTPVIANLKNSRNYIMEAGQTLWYNPKQKNQVGLPAPVSRLLEQLSNRED